MQNQKYNPFVLIYSGIVLAGLGGLNFILLLNREGPLSIIGILLLSWIMLGTIYYWFVYPRTPNYFELSGFTFFWIGWGITVTDLQIIDLSDNQYLQLIALGLGIALYSTAGVYLAWQLKKSNWYLMALRNRINSDAVSQGLVVNSIADAIISVDNQLGVTLMNPAAQKLTGWDLSQARGLNIGQILILYDQSGNQLQETSPFYKVLATAKVIRDSDIYLFDKTQQRIDLSISAAPSFDTNKNINGVIAIIRDISEQKATEREKDEFISTASHEMRTPVTAIEGNLSLALNPKLATIDDRARKFLDKAHQSVLHLGSLFKDLLSTTQIDDNANIGQLEIVDLNKILKKVFEEMQTIAQSKAVELILDFGGNGAENTLAPSAPIRANQDKINEVVSNLVDNAIKFSNHGRVTIRSKVTPDYCLVEVEDDGIGISPEDQKHLFQKFYRVNNSFTREIGGTGLGLYIARNIIEKFGGRIWVSSIQTPDQHGTIFSFSLPLAKDANQAKIPEYLQNNPTNMVR